MLKVYIAGPITGLPNFNREAFFAAAENWEKLGWQVINPAAYDDPQHVLPWRVYMIRDIKMLVDCDAIAMLPGWKKSAGARVERWLARILSIRIFDALHPAKYQAHTFIYPGNICCFAPDYVHEQQWKENR